MEPQSTLYVGDRIDDERAAKIARIEFRYASWSYGGNHATDHFRSNQILRDPISLVDFIQTHR